MRPDSDARSVLRVVTGCFSVALSLQACTYAHDAAAGERCSIGLHLDVLEGEELIQEVRCPGERIELHSLPSGAVFDPRRSELRWTPALDQAGHYVLELQITGAGKAGEITLDVIDDLEDPENVPPVDPTHYRSEYGLPILHLTLRPRSTTTPTNQQ